MESIPKKEILIMVNGKTVDYSQKILIKEKVETVQKFLSLFVKQTKYNSSIIDKGKIFNQKGVELDDNDIPYIKDQEIIFISLDGAPFDSVNYLNEYTFIRPIKKGGYAEVYLAKNALTQKEISIKKIDLTRFSSGDIYNISREALYLSNLNHRNIVKMYGNFSHNNYVYTLMDYCKGGELTQIIVDPNPIPEDQLKNFFGQIHEAVKFIHSQNIVHRDLKPNNILFLDKEKTHLVIIDFGISGMCNGNNREIIKAGTLRYTPPEIISGHEYQSSSKIDIWALGIILYLMAFKVFPFEGTESEICKKICEQHLPFPKKQKIKKSLANLLRGLLQKNPDERIDINDPLFEQWYNDDSEEYESDRKRLAVIMSPLFKTKFDSHKVISKHVPGYLLPTQVSTRRASCIRKNVNKSPFSILKTKK